MFDSISIGEIAIILIVALIVMGPERFPEVAKIMMRAFRDFRAYVDDIKRDIAQEIRPVQDELSKMSRFDPMTYVEAVAKSIELGTDDKKEEGGAGSQEDGGEAVDKTPPNNDESDTPSEESSGVHDVYEGSDGTDETLPPNTPERLDG